MKNKLVIGFLTLTIIVLGAWVWRSVSELKAGQADLNFAQTGVTPESLNRRSEGGGVTVDAILLNAAEKAPEGELAFELALNTHSVPLEDYDVTKNAVLRTKDGVSDQGFTWEPVSEVAHHRSGILRIKTGDLVSSRTPDITLELRNLAGVPVREFKWDLPK